MNRTELRVPERIQYKLAVLAYEVLHRDAPRYLGPLTRVDDLSGRRTLRSTNANYLVVPPVKQSTVGSRAFAAAAPHPHIYDTRCYFNVRSKADISQLNLPHLEYTVN